MIKFICISLLLAFNAVLYTAAHADSVDDINFPLRIIQSDSGKVLQLNGYGIQMKYLLEEYVVGLYLTKSVHTVEAVLKQKTPRRIVMYCRYYEIDKNKLTESWNNWFAKNNSKLVLKNIQQRIKLFNRLFPALRRKDIVIFDYIPGKGTIIYFNHHNLGIIPGLDFNNALLRVWLGKAPADPELKVGLLGNSPG